MFHNAEDTITKKNWDWRVNPIKIRAGQVWKKNSGGNICIVTRVASDCVYTQQPRKKKCHHVSKKDLLMFWKKVEG